MLNLFAYTGAFSVHARVGGADRTTTVDLSKTYLEWYQRNCELNALAEDDCHIWIQDDCLQFLEDGPKPGESYDTIVLDPPTFSNSKRMRDTFSVGRDHAYLIECAAALWPLVANCSFPPTTEALNWTKRDCRHTWNGRKSRIERCQKIFETGKFTERGDFVRPDDRSKSN